MLVFSAISRWRWTLGRSHSVIWTRAIGVFRARKRNRRRVRKWPWQNALKTECVSRHKRALGGLIQERETNGKTKIPVLGDVPILGNAFRQKSNATSRTELIIFIRPRVIRDMDEARQVTEEFRKQLSIQAPQVRRGETTPGEELVKILN